MAQVTTSFLPVKKSPIPNVVNTIYQGFKKDVTQGGQPLPLGDCYPSISSPVDRIVEQFTADKAPKVVFATRSFCDIKQKQPDYPVSYIYDTSDPVSKLAFSPISTTIGPKDWGGIEPIAQPHMDQAQVALFNSVYFHFELLAPLPHWINLSMDKTRIIAPLIGLSKGGQVRMSCDLCEVKMPANDWQIASVFSTPLRPCIPLYLLIIHITMFILITICLYIITIYNMCLNFHALWFFVSVVH